MRGLTWITSAWRVQTTALQESEEAAPLATGRAGRGPDEGQPPPVQRETTPPRRDTRQLGRAL